jgi:eukaryotic translation initiation factor 2C
VIGLKENILRAAQTQGMKLAPSSGNNDYFALNMMRARPGELEKLLEQCLKKGYKIVFVIIIDRNDCYAQVKQAAELKVGILTQCIKANTVFRMERNPMMTVNNILLKVNAKLNGKNHEVVEPSYQRFNSLNDGVMFVGGDVTHPSPDQRDIPSVVGVACSYDQVGFRYQCAWRLQDPKMEMIVDLQNILTEHLKFYKQKNGRLPGKIMYYRDGVSEGQFSEVLSVEMTAIRGALKAMYGTNPPAKVTFIVVQKRHHTRFFPTQKEFT